VYHPIFLRIKALVASSCRLSYVRPFWSPSLLSGRPKYHLETYEISLHQVTDEHVEQNAVPDTSPEGT